MKIKGILTENMLVNFLSILFVKARTSTVKFLCVHNVTTVHNCTSLTDAYNECKLFDETTTAEVSEDEDRGKRPLKKKSFGTDFVSGKLGFFPF